MANLIEKIFKLTLNIADENKLQTLKSMLQNVLATIDSIGKADGLRKVVDVTGAYATTLSSADKAKKNLVSTSKQENAQNAEEARYLEDLKNKYGNLIFTKRQLSTLSRNYNTLLVAEKGSVEELGAQISTLNVMWSKMGGEQRKSLAGKQVTADLKNMRNEMRLTTMGAGDYSRNIGNYFSGIYNNVTRMIGGATAVVYTFRRLITSIFSPFKEFEQRMAMVRAVSGATDEEFVRLNQNARKLGATTEYTASEVAELQLTYARMGFIPEQIEKITGATLDLATATGEGLAKSADVVGIVLRVFDLDASKTQHVVDVMEESFNKSSLGLESFYEGIKMVAPIAKEANVSLETTVAMLGVLADRGIRGSMAGTALRQIFSEIAKSGGDVNQRLETLAKTGLTIGDAYDEVGQRAMAALTILVNSKEDVDSFTESLHDSAGAAAEAAGIMRDTMSGDIDVFLSAIQEGLIATGELLAPLARSVIKFGTWLVSNIKQVSITIGVAYASWKALNFIKAAYLVVTGKLLITETSYGKLMKVNMAALNSSTGATRLLAAAKFLLTGQIKACVSALKGFKVALASTGIGLLIVGVSSLIAWLLSSKDETKEASDAYSQAARSIDEETKAVDDLKKAVKESEDGSVNRRDLIEQINEKYGEYLPNLISEKSTQEEIITALDGVNKKLEENIRLKFASQVIDEERQKILDSETVLLDKIKKEWEETHRGQQLSVEEELRMIEIVENYSTKVQDILTGLNNGTISAGEEVRNGIDESGKEIQLYFASAELSMIKLYTLQSDLQMGLYDPVKRLSEAAAIVSNENPDDLSQDLPSGGGDRLSKVDWSLSNDKEHNRQLAELKQQFYDGQIATEEQYQKQILQLEIDTLNRRLELNKNDEKARGELINRLLKQKKEAQKEEETFTANRDAQAEKERKFENDRIDAEVAAMADGVAKKIALNDQVTRKAQESAEKESTS